MKDPIKVNNIILDKSRVVWILYDENDSRNVTVRFEDGHQMPFVGNEAIEIWKLFDDDKGYQEDGR